MEMHPNRALASQTTAEDEQNAISLSRRPVRIGSVSPLFPRNTSSESPKTILLALWSGAQHQQIHYYLQGYAAVYPSAHVVLLYPSRRSPKHIDFVLQALAGDPKPARKPKQDILVHLFGDEAAAQVCRLLRAYRVRTGQPLAVKALILDSAPVFVVPNYKTLRTEPQQQLPLFVCLFVMAFFGSLVSVLTSSFHRHPRRDFHDPKLLPADTRKCYIFPEKGLMFTWYQPLVEDEVCERQEFHVKRKRVGRSRERWTGDQERYWLGIESAWEGHA